MHYNNLPSSSTIDTVASPGSPRVTRGGSVDESIEILKSSVFSNTSSSIIGTSNEALVCPAGNVTLYGPEP